MRRLVGTIHLWIGFALCVPLVALGLTGSYLTYAEDVRGWLDPSPARLLAEGAPKSAVEILAAARAAAPEGHVASLYTPQGENGFAAVRFARGAPGPGVRQVRVEVDPVSLATTPVPVEGSFLRNLHTSLLLQDIAGRSVVGWLGVAMLALGVTGVVNWWPRKAYRWRGKTRAYLKNHDIHGTFGIWFLIVFLLVSFSGVYLCFPQTLRSAVETMTPVRDLRSVVAALKVEPVPGATPMTLDEVVTLASSGAPDARVAFVSLPQRPNQPFRVTLLEPGQEVGTPTPALFIDPWTQRIVAKLDPREFTAAEAAIAWQHGLHEGRGLGPVWRFLVFVSGFLPLLFVITGLRIWWLKRCARIDATG